MRLAAWLSRGLCATAALSPLVLGLAAHALDFPAANPAPPQVLFGELFAAVQNARVFVDGKDFADALPNLPPQRIVADYREQHPESAEELRRFVAARFALPLPIEPAATSPDGESIITHIDRLWTALTRATLTTPPFSSLLSLPKPYVVPGGRFREMYYWDSYFTMLGLAQSGRLDLAQDMVSDFAYLIDRFGHVPNGTRSYYLSRSQPPFFFEMVALLSPDDPTAAYARYLSQLRREYSFWMKGGSRLRRGTADRRVVAMPDGSLLNRFWDDRDTPRDESYREDTELARTSGREPHQLYREIRAAAESGWDFSSRWFADGHDRATMDTTEIVPVDLNSLMFGLESAIGAGCKRVGDASCARDFERRAVTRHAAIDRYLWDTGAGAYLDYRWTRRRRISRLSAATLYPLFVGVASPHQAAAVAAAAHALLRDGGIVATPLDTGQQWDSPNGWAPLQWIAIDGLRRYQRNTLATTIACRWMSGVNRVYGDSGKLLEKYDVVNTGRRGGGGEYPTQDGFGWTNGVMRKLMALYPADAGNEASAACVMDRSAIGHSLSTIQPRASAAPRNSTTSVARM